VSSRSYNRVLVKLSGNCFGDPGLLEQVARQLVKASSAGVAVAVVMGGGNILRGRETSDMDPVAADKAGMLATVINGLRLADRLRRDSQVLHLSAVGVSGTVEGYDVWTAREALQCGAILVLSGGTGNPFFSTDSAAALRAVELQMDAILKGTRVDGVYSSDPEKDPKAKRYARLSFGQALKERLAVMDLTAFALCMERKVPVVVFDIRRPGAILDIIKGKRIGSLVC
jgi:uridylate kinase